MAQGTYTLGRSALTAAELHSLAKAEDRRFKNPDATTWLAHKTAMAAFALTITTDFYDKTTALVAFSAAIETDTNVKKFSEDVPTDCREGGITTLQIKTHAGLYVAPAKVLNKPSADWSYVSTDTVYWEMQGRKLLVLVPVSMDGANLKWAVDYKRLPTFPQVDADYLDIPAENEQDYLNLWKGIVRTDA